MVQGEPWGLHGFFSTFRLACSNLRQENEEVWRCSSLSSICWDYVLNGKCSDWCPVECVGCYHCGVMCFDWLPSWYCVCVGCLLCVSWDKTLLSYYIILGPPDINAHSPIIHVDISGTDRCPSDLKWDLPVLIPLGWNICINYRPSFCQTPINCCSYR